MRLFLFECKLILKNKMYLLYCAIFLFLFLLTVKPFQLGENLRPLDGQHILLQRLFHDSEKDEIVNEYMEQDIEELEKMRNGYAQDIKIYGEAKQKLFYKIEQNKGDKKLEKELAEWQKSLEDISQYITECEKTIPKLKEQIVYYEKHSVKKVTSEIKKEISEIIEQIIPQIGNGKYTKKQLMEMDTDIFQNVEISISKKEFDKILCQIDEVLGGDTYYGTKDLYNNNYREQCVEISGYNSNFRYQIQKDKDKEISLEEAVQFYEQEVKALSYSGIFVGFLCDKIGIILCLTLCILLFVFYLSTTSDIRDILYKKPISASSFILQKYSSMVCMAILPCILVLSVVNMILYMRGTSYGYDVDFFVLYSSFFVWILPEVLFILAIGMFVILCFENVLFPFFLEAVFFGLTVNDLYGEYGYSKVVLRYNILAQSEFLEQCRPAIYQNRIFYLCLSVFTMGGVIGLYYLKKNGIRFIWLEWISFLKEQGKEKGKKLGEFLAVKLGIDERRRERESKAKEMFYYQFKLGFAKSMLFCILFDFASYICFWKDMSGMEYCFRFVLLNGIILFSGIGLQEREGNCNDIVLLHNVKHVRILQNVIAVALVTGWNYLFCYSVAKPTDEACIIVIVGALILGEICTVVSKLKCGVIGGVMASLLVYIIGVICII